MLARILAFFGLGKRPAPAQTPLSSERAATRGSSGPAAGSRAAEIASAFEGVAADNVDTEERLHAVLCDEEENLLLQFEGRLETGDFELPQLSSTTVALMGVVHDPKADVQSIAKLITADPMLSGQLVKTANSVLYGGREPVKSIQDGVMRLGLRAIRTLILAISMRSTLYRGKRLRQTAETVWRQAQSVARISKAIAPILRDDPEHAFTIGLLHDVGKVPLIAMLREDQSGVTISPALVSRVFNRLHEQAGAALAGAWELGDELVSICANHHDYRSNAQHAHDAALVSLAHKLDLYQSLGDANGFLELAHCDEMDALRVPEARRFELLDAAREAFVAAADEPPAQAA
jgi:putative nucleotidyltransferase with HDIG domain